MSKQISAYARCPECGGQTLIKDMEMGESICGECGLVIRDKILDPGAEWRAFTLEERRMKSRAGAPINYSHYDKGLSTIIRVEKDSFGRSLPRNVRNQMWRLRKWQIRSRAQTSQNRNLIRAMAELQRLSGKLHIPSSVQNVAAVIYRKALKKELVRGRCIASLVAGALYAACRFVRIPRTLREIVKVSPRDRKEISRAYRLIVREVGINMPVDAPLGYVTKIAEKAGASNRVEGQAIKIIRDAKRSRLTFGKDPSGLAAAALYIASKIEKENLTQSHLAQAANVTEVTIRNRKKELIEKLHLESMLESSPTAT